MKNLITLLLLLTPQLHAEEKIVPLDMELGYWEITTEIDMEEMLAKIPEEQRAALRGMMSSKMQLPVMKQCVTQNTLKDMEAQLRNSLKSKTEDCDLQVVKSTAKEFNGLLVCAQGVTKATIQTRLINSKRHESNINSDIEGLGQNKIKTVGEWKSAKCPEGM